VRAAVILCGLMALIALIEYVVFLLPAYFD
jgi:hypothetical protein